MNINQFMARIAPANIARPSHFQVLISRPLIRTQNSLASDLKTEYEMTFRCEACELPGRTIMTVDDAYHFGVPVRRAVARNITDITLNFILSEDYNEKLYFEDWQDAMIGDFRSGIQRPEMYLIGYHSEYAGLITITTFDETGAPSYVCRLIDAFPLAIGNVVMNWGSGNEAAKLAVSFTFTRFED